MDCCRSCAALLLLAGCAASQPEPVVQTKTVEVPVREPCHVDDIPAVQYPFDSAQISDPIDRKVQLLAADRLARSQTERLLRAALDGCRK